MPMSESGVDGSFSGTSTTRAPIVMAVAAMLMAFCCNIKSIRSLRHGKMQDLPFLHHAVQNAINRRPAEKRVRMMEAGIYFVGCRMV